MRPRPLSPANLPLASTPTAISCCVVSRIRPRFSVHWDPKPLFERLAQPRPSRRLRFKPDGRSRCHFGAAVTRLAIAEQGGALCARAAGQALAARQPARELLAPGSQPCYPPPVDRKWSRTLGGWCGDAQQGGERKPVCLGRTFRAV